MSGIHHKARSAPHVDVNDDEAFSDDGASLPEDQPVDDIMDDDAYDTEVEIAKPHASVVAISDDDDDDDDDDTASPQIAIQRELIPHEGRDDVIPAGGAIVFPLIGSGVVLMPGVMATLDAYDTERLYKGKMALVDPTGPSALGLAIVKVDDPSSEYARTTQMPVLDRDSADPSRPAYVIVFFLTTDKGIIPIPDQLMLTDYVRRNNRVMHNVVRKVLVNDVGYAYIEGITVAMTLTERNTTKTGRLKQLADLSAQLGGATKIIKHTLGGVIPTAWTVICPPVEPVGAASEPDPPAAPEPAEKPKPKRVRKRPPPKKPAEPAENGETVRADPKPKTKAAAKTVDKDISEPMNDISTPAAAPAIEPDAQPTVAAVAADPVSKARPKRKSPDSATGDHAAKRQRRLPPFLFGSWTHRKIMLILDSFQSAIELTSQLEAALHEMIKAGTNGNLTNIYCESMVPTVLDNDTGMVVQMQLDTNDNPEGPIPAGTDAHTVLYKMLAQNQ